MKKNLLLISLVAIVNALGYGIIIPVLYSYSKKYGLTDTQNGFLFATFSLCQLISTPIIGRLSDKYGRKPLLAISLFGSAISFFVMAFAPSAIFLFLARALDGITAGNMPVISAIIADSTEEKDRGRGFAILGASFGFGFVLGPAISAITVGINYSLPFIIAGLVSLLAVTLTLITLGETNKHIGEVANKHFFDIKTLVTDITDKNIFSLLVIFFFYTMAFSMFTFSFQPFSIKILNLDVSHISIIFTGIGIIGIITQAYIFPKLSKLINLRTLYLGNFLLLAIVFILLSFSTNFLYFASILLLLSLFNSFISPISQTFLSKSADSKSQGSIQGIGSTFTSLGQIAGPIVGGILSTFALKYSFVGSALLILVCAILARHFTKTHFHKESAF